MTAITAFVPTAFNLYAFQIDPFGYPRRGGSQGGKTRRKKLREAQRLWDEEQRLLREEAAKQREAVQPALEEAARLVKGMHHEQIEPRIENAERLLEYLTKPFAVYTPAKIIEKPEGAKRTPVPLSLDAMLEASPTIGALTGAVDVEVAVRPPTPEQLADLVEVIEAYLDAEEE